LKRRDLTTAFARWTLSTTARKPVSAGAEIDFPAGKRKAEELCTAVHIKYVKPAHAGYEAFYLRHETFAVA
jgi:hypothetical protein